MGLIDHDWGTPQCTQYSSSRNAGHLANRTDGKWKDIPNISKHRIGSEISLIGVFTDFSSVVESRYSRLFNCGFNTSNVQSIAPKKLPKAWKAGDG